jgi:hypothetical protein
MEPVRLKPVFWDIVPIAVVFAIAIYPVFRSTDRGSVAVVYRGGERLAEIHMANDTTFEIESAVGPMTIVVEDNAVSVSDASCPKKICVATGPVYRPGAAIVCAPGKTAIVVEGREETDAITR